MEALIKSLLQMRNLQKSSKLPRLSESEKRLWRRKNLLVRAVRSRILSAMHPWSNNIRTLSYSENRAMKIWQWTIRLNPNASAFLWKNQVKIQDLLSTRPWN